jgi:peptide/nickel transport system substrate-binding protein
MKFKHPGILPVLLALLSVYSCTADKASEAAAVDFKRTSNEVIVRIDADPERIHPLIAIQSYSTLVSSQIFSFLLSTDDQTLQLVPELAVARPTVETIATGPYAGGLSYTFEIREAAVWPNNTPVTAADFIFTLKATLHPLVQAQRLRPYLAFIKDIQIDPTNPKKFTVLTNDSYFLAEEAIGSVIPVMPAYQYDPEGLLAAVPLTTFTDAEKIEALAKTDANLQAFAEKFQSPEFSSDPALISGSGPYTLERWDKGQELVLKKKENYWGDGVSTQDGRSLEAFPDRLIFKPIPNAATVLSLIKSEEIDVVSGLDPLDFVELQQSEMAKERYELVAAPSDVYTFIYLNTRNPKLSDKKVRRALAHAINVDEIITELYEGFGTRTPGPVYPQAPYYNKSLELIPYNPSLARKMLEEAGWTDSDNNGIVDKEINGERVELTLNCNFSGNREVSRNTVLLLKDQMQRAGIGLNPVGAEFNVYLAETRRGDFEMTLGARNAQTVSWEPRQTWHTEAIGTGSNFSGFGNPESDALIEAIQSNLDETTRFEQYRALQQMIYEEQPFVFLFSAQNRLAVHKRFKTQTSVLYPGYALQKLQLIE